MDRINGNIQELELAASRVKAPKAPREWGVGKTVFFPFPVIFFDFKGKNGVFSSTL